MLAFAAACLFQGAWSIDFSHAHTVYLPTIAWTLTISGQYWFIGGYALLSAGWLGLATYIKITRLTFPLYTLIPINYYLTPSWAYGLIWNDLFYAIAIPSMMGIAWKFKNI